MVDTCHVTGVLVAPDGKPLAGIVALFERHPRQVYPASPDSVAPQIVRATADGSGAISVNLVPAQYKVTTQPGNYPPFLIVVPDEPSANLADIQDAMPEPYLTQAQQIVQQARAAKDDAEDAKAGAEQARDDAQDLVAAYPAAEEIATTGALDSLHDEISGTVEPLVKGRVNFYDHRDVLLPVQLPADQEVVARTRDGYAIIYRDDEEIVVGGMRVSLTESKAAADTVEAGDAEFGGTGPFAVLTADGYPLMAEDAVTGMLEVALSPQRFVYPGSRNLLDGTIQPGTVTNIHAMGEWFGYHVQGAAYTGPVVGRRMGDWASPHLPLCDEIEVWEADGQSWQTISDYTADEIDIEEPSGATGDAVRAAVTPMVSLLRKSNFLDSPQDDEDYTAIVPTISNGAVAGELARFRPDWRYSIAQMAAACAVHHRGKLGTDNPPIVMLGVGWPGTSYEKFLPEGSSISYTDRDGNPQTVNAEEHPNAGAYLWSNSTARRDSVISTVATRWPGRSLLWRTLSWIQGVPDDDHEYMAFMNEYRAQQDLLGLGTRDILWDQNGGTTRREIQPWGIQAQLEFCQTNTSGHDWLVGPRYPHRLRDYIHHSSFGALEYAERTGQAKAYVDRYGEWEPLWITDVQFNGSDVVLTINRPRQTVGDLLVDDETIPAAPNHGFTLWDATSDVEIPIEGVAVGADTITLTTGSTLSGSIEVGYAVRGSQNPDGTVESPQLSATVGNIKRKGRDAPAIIPQSVQPTLDHWLCQYRKIHEV